MRDLMHVITGLSTGGAEMMLFKLLTLAKRGSCGAVVVSLMDGGTIGRRINALGVPVVTLGMRRGMPDPFALIRLARAVRRIRPIAIQGWMYHGNLAATLAARCTSDKIPVFWNIRQSLYEIRKERSITRLTIRLGSWLSSIPEKIIYNSKISALQHEAMGYKPEKSIVIPNGFDLQEFRPDSRIRQQIRRELGVPNDAVAIGLVARWHPMKDHANFLGAASLLLQQDPHVHFVLVGKGSTKNNGEVWKLASKLSPFDNIHLLGERRDIPDILASLDIATSSSAWGEGFPNVVGEAMACGVPCVVTDVGDSAVIVGETGLVVPPRAPADLATAWMKMIVFGREIRQRLGLAARQRVAENFALDVIFREYQALYDRVVDSN
jgi:glycosyltransferase involved in cell wall biosynthesis